MNQGTEMLFHAFKTPSNGQASSLEAKVFKKDRKMKKWRSDLEENKKEEQKWDDVNFQVHMYALVCIYV